MIFAVPFRRIFTFLAAALQIYHLSFESRRIDRRTLLYTDVSVGVLSTFPTSLSKVEILLYVSSYIYSRGYSASETSGIFHVFLFLSKTPSSSCKTSIFDYIPRTFLELLLSILFYILSAGRLFRVEMENIGILSSSNKSSPTKLCA